MTGIVVVATLTLVASFLCSLFEAALYSITPSQVEVLKAGGRPGAARLARMRADVEAPIAAILTVNTIAHTVGAAWCGAMVATRFGAGGVPVFAAVFTILVLALTEIVPKSLGVRFARRLATAIVWPLQLMIWSVWPVVWLARKSMRLLMGPKAREAPSEEEVVLFSGLAAKGGTVRPEEHRWVENALRLDRVTAGDLRTPRTVVESFPAETRVGDVAQLAERWNHSRVPLTEGTDPLAVVGLVHRREVFDAALGGRGEVPLRDLMRPILFVPLNMRAHALLDLFLEERSHMAAVVSEYGVFRGLVTLEDVLECLLGAEIVDEHDTVADKQELALRRRPRLEDPEAGGSAPPPSRGAEGD